MLYGSEPRKIRERLVYMARAGLWHSRHQPAHLINLAGPTWAKSGFLLRLKKKEFDKFTLNQELNIFELYQAMISTFYD